MGSCCWLAWAVLAEGQPHRGPASHVPLFLWEPPQKHKGEWEGGCPNPPNSCLARRLSCDQVSTLIFAHTQDMLSWPARRKHQDAGLELGGSWSSDLRLSWHTPAIPAAWKSETRGFPGQRFSNMCLRIKKTEGWGHSWVVQHPWVQTVVRWGRQMNKYRFTNTSLPVLLGHLNFELALHSLEGHLFGGCQESAVTSLWDNNRCVQCNGKLYHRKMFLRFRVNYFLIWTYCLRKIVVKIINYQETSNFPWRVKIGI